MGRSFSFALIAGLLFSVVIIINIIASSNLKAMDDDHHMGGGGAVKNVVLFVGSGLGPAGVTLTRAFQETLRKGDASVPTSLSFEPFLTATLRTRSSSSGTSDAAAAASALATGKKTANGMVAIDPQTKKEVVSILEKAKQAGLKTGFVTTDELTGPVAAAFTSHMEGTTMPGMVASSQLSTKFDLLMGGGSTQYTGDHAKAWTDASYSILVSADDLAQATKLPLLGLFAEKRLGFAIDAKKADVDKKQPSLAQMTKKALDLLRSDNQKGFVLVIEAGNIDACAQSHDAACLAHEVLAMQESFEAVADLVTKAKDTACLIASDRDSGGLVLTDWDPSKLTASSASVQVISEKLKASANAKAKDEILAATNITISETEAAVIEGLRAGDQLASKIGDTLSAHAGISWGSAGDTGVDVNLYACGDASTDVPRGNVDNTAVGVYLMKKISDPMSHSTPAPTSSGHGGGGHHH
jgi:alkaline phosphatase